jgi:hypothetical protein
MANTYSFLDTAATLAGPGGTVSLGAGAAVAEEGITIGLIEETDELKVGADGSPMHSLNAAKSYKFTVRLLKTSPTNSVLSAMYALQRTSAATWGVNSLSLLNSTLGDSYTLKSVAFAKFPENTYAKNAAMLDWEFLAGVGDVKLGKGL